tara:strand:- start:760 stop:963 length:204 start_codon:yes stop_codon:yes gene_type:complete
MFEKIKKIFKKKPKDKPLVLKDEKRTYEKKIDHSNDITFENEINKPKVKSETRETKSETTSSLTFGE